MLPQPPPDAPAPPSSEAPLVLHENRKWLWIIGGGAILFILLLNLLVPLHFRCSKKADSTEAVNNARQICLALFEFQTEYGKFPDAGTAAAVRLRTETELDLGGASSNAFFRQLLAAGIAQSETMFYAKVTGTRKPDNNFSLAEALKKGGVGSLIFWVPNPLITRIDLW